MRRACGRVRAERRPRLRSPLGSLSGSSTFWWGGAWVGCAGAATQCWRVASAAQHSARAPGASAGSPLHAHSCCAPARRGCGLECMTAARPGQR